MNYNIVIHKEKGNYCFQLWYCGKQAMGNSKFYESRSLCIKGFEDFKNWIIKNDIHDECNFLKLNKISDRKFIYQFVDENNEILYTSRIIETKTNCRNSMISTCKNIIKAKVKDLK